jgi:hypothetical protein
VAVTVKHAPFVTLDIADRIVGVGPHVESQFGPLVGSVMWECFPGSEPLFKPYYDRARESGEPVDFVQFYDGNVARLSATPRDDGRLDLAWEQLARLDTTTLETLVGSLAESLEHLDAERDSELRDELRKTLRVIEGGVL